MSFENILKKLKDHIISLYPDITQDELTLRMQLGEEMLQRLLRIDGLPAQEIG